MAFRIRCILSKELSVRLALAKGKERWDLGGATGNAVLCDSCKLIYGCIYREWDATRSPKIRGFKRFFEYFRHLLIIYERSKFLGDALFLVC